MNPGPFFNQDSCINEAFGHYQVIEELGQGGMGKVYKALDTNLNRIVALKVLLNHSDPEFIKRFLREARSIASLEHPNIIRIYEVKQFRNIFYYAMEYIEGITLHDWLVSNKDYRKTAILMEKVALAIDYAHSKNIIHRDLKPGNIMIDKNDIPYVMDFGLVKLVDVPGQLTKTGDILGTPTYMSPEQAQGDQKLVDAKTDIYSLGVVLYEMLCGEVPFDDRSPWNILVKVIEQNPTSVRKIDANIPTALENICLKAMAKQKINRYNSAREFANDLRRFYKGRKIYTRRPSRISHFTKRSKVIGTLFVISLFFLSYSLFFPQINTTNEIPFSISNVQNNFEYAKNLIKQGFYKEAQALLEKELVKSSKKYRPQIQKYLFLNLVNLKKYEQAQKAHKQLSKKMSNSDDVQLSIAKIYFYEQQFDKAEQKLSLLLKNQITTHATQIQVLYFKGLLHFRKKEFRHALDNFKKVQQILPQLRQAFSEQPFLFLHMGKCYFYLDQIIKAQSHFIKAQKWLPESDEIYKYLGKCSLKGRVDLNKAEKSFEKCIEMRPRNSNYHYLYGLTLSKQGKYHAASHAFVRALQYGYNKNALNNIFSLPQKDAFLLFECFQNIVYYSQNLHSTEKPNLIKPLVKKIADKYHSSYVSWRVAQKQKQNPKIFIDKLAISNSPKIRMQAIEALFTLRYHKELKFQLEQTLQNITNKSKQKQLKQVWHNIENKKKSEQKQLAYYHTSQLYLQDDYQFPKEVTISLLQKILLDKNEQAIYRFLAARTLLLQHNFTFVQKVAAKQEKTASFLANLALKELGFPVSPETFLSEKLDHTPLIKIILANNMVYVKQLWDALQKENVLIKVHMAANLANNEHTPPSIVNKARETLLLYTKIGQRTEIRQFAHYYLWRSYIAKDTLASFNRSTIPLDKQYKEALLHGVNDPNPNIQKAILFSAIKVNFPEYYIQLERLAKNAPTEEICYAALTSLWIYEPTHPIIDQIINDQQQPYTTRVYAFILYMMNVKPKKNSKISLKRVLGSLNYIKKLIPKIAQESQPNFRGSLFCLLCVFFGSYVLPYVEKEKDPGVVAGLLFSLGHDSPTSIFHGTTRSQKIEVVKKYLYHKNANICKSAVATYIKLSDDKQREILLNKIDKSSNKIFYKGAARGMYELLISNIEAGGQFGQRLHAKPYEEKYDDLLIHLTNKASNRKTRQKYLKWIHRTIELDDLPEYRLIRAILYRLDHKTKLAIYDLQKALEHNPDSNRYLIELARTYYDMQQYNKVKSLLLQLKIDKHQLKIGYRALFLAWNIKDLDFAKTLCSELYLQAPKRGKKRYLIFPTSGGESVGVSAKVFFYMSLLKIMAQAKQDKELKQHIQHLQKSITIDDDLYILRRHHQFRLLPNK